ncbi:MAG TPA: hypothetical protein VIU16_01950 [Gaiellaceae bacterium]
MRPGAPAGGGDNPAEEMAEVRGARPSRPTSPIQGAAVRRMRARGGRGNPFARGR